MRGSINRDNLIEIVFSLPGLFNRTMNQDIYSDETFAYQ